MFVIPVIFLTGFVFKSYGQGPPEFGFFAGPQLTWADYKVDGIKQETSHKYGMQGGLLLKVPFDNKLFFAPGIYYNLKGYKVQLNNAAFPPSTLATDNEVTVHTIEVAGLLQYDFSKNGTGFFIKAGPAFDVAIKGHEKFSLLNDTIVSQPMKFSFGDYGRITAAINFQLGYEFSNRAFILVNYSHGWGSMNNADGGPKIKHRIAGLTVGKYFTRKKD